MDRNTQEEIRAHLMQTNEHFRDLMNRHHQYDERAAELDSKHALTEAEEIEEHRLKKLKLHLKDEMEKMTIEYKLQQVAG